MKTKYILFATLLLSQTAPVWAMDDPEDKPSITPQIPLENGLDKKIKFKKSYTFLKKIGNRDMDIDPKDAIITVHLTSITINRVSRPDLLSQEEGSIVIKFGPQNKVTQTTLFWSGNTKGTYHIKSKDLHFDYGKDLLLFFSPLKDLTRLDFSVSVIEDDEGDKAKWKKAAEAIAAVGQVSSAIPQYGAPIAAGLGVVSSGVDLIAQSHRNTTELSYHGNFFEYNSKNKNIDFLGDWVIGYNRKGKKNEDLCLCFSLKSMPSIVSLFPDFPKKNSEKVGIQVILENLDIPTRIASKIGKTTVTHTPKGLALLELNVGGKPTKYETYPNAFRQNRFSVSNVEVYRGEWMTSGIPTSVSLVYEEEGVKFGKLVSSTAELTKSLIPDDKAADKAAGKPGAKDKLTPAIDIMQTLSSSVLAGVSPDSKYTLFSVGTKLLRKPQQTISFPMYSNKGQKELGKITAIMKILPCILEGNDSADGNSDLFRKAGVVSGVADSNLKSTKVTTSERTTSQKLEIIEKNTITSDTKIAEKEKRNREKQGTDTKRDKTQRSLEKQPKKSSKGKDEKRTDSEQQKQGRDNQRPKISVAEESSNS